MPCRGGLCGLASPFSAPRNVSSYILQEVFFSLSHFVSLPSLLRSPLAFSLRSPLAFSRISTSVYSTFFLYLLFFFSLSLVSTIPLLLYPSGFFFLDIFLFSLCFLPPPSFSFPFLSISFIFSLSSNYFPQLPSFLLPHFLSHFTMDHFL